LLGKLQESAQAFQAVARPKMQALARRFDETTSIAYLFSDHVRVLDSIESYQDIRAINKIGRILPPYASSMGKAITAFQSRQLIDRLVEVYGLFRRTEHTNTDRNTIFAEFERIRKDGYAYDRGEAMDGGLCTGAPIFFPNGRVEASISVSVPLIRMNTEREKEILAAILRASQEISVALKAS
jgi:DNA-binding IclR family transcriptional regulator